MGLQLRNPSYYIKINLILQINIFNAIPRAHWSEVSEDSLKELKGPCGGAGEPLMPHSSQLTLIINEPLNISKMQSKAAQLWPGLCTVQLGLSEYLSKNILYYLNATE